MDIKTVRKEMPVLSQDQSENKKWLTWCNIYFSIKVVWCIIIKIIIKRIVNDGKHFIAFYLRWVCIWGKFTMLYCIRKWNINTDGNILSDQISHEKQSLYIYTII